MGGGEELGAEVEEEVVVGVEVMVGKSGMRRLRTATKRRWMRRRRDRALPLSWGMQEGEGLVGKMGHER